MPDVRLSPTRPLALALFLLALSPTATAQDVPKNSVYFELGGSGLFYTLNYERTLLEDVYFERVNARIGFGAAAQNARNGGPLVWSTLMIHPLTTKKHGPDLGLGVLYLYDPGGWLDDVLGIEQGPCAAFAIGYRYQSPGGGRVFRFSFTPLLSPETVFAWGGLSLGVAF